MKETGYEAFCEAAGVILEREARSLLDGGLNQISALESRWHPSGFAVFHLDDDHELGKLRLHIWPDSGRVVRPDNAPIHTHVWHLCSRILVGTYSEKLYGRTESASIETKEYHSAAINYLTDKDSFTAPSKASLTPVATVSATKGGLHSVPADVPHETLIGTNSYVATLLITSHPVSAQAIMYSQQAIRASTYDRPVLSNSQKFELLNRLEQELKNQARVKN